MKYITVREAAEKWNISERQAQQLCIAGRIEGATKFGSSWAIPEDAEKPSDPRRGRPKAVQTGGESIPAPTEAEKLRVPMPLMNTAFKPGHCLEAVESIEDPETRRMAMAEYHYFSGRAEEAAAESEVLLMHSDPAIRLSALWVYGYSNLATGHIHKVHFALAEVREALDSICEDTPSELKAMAGSIAMGAAVLLHLPLPDGLPSMQENIRYLPPGLRMFAMYVTAHKKYLDGDYSGSIGMVEATLAVATEPFPIPMIYLHLVATMDYMSLKEPEKAKEHLMAAWNMAKADDLIEALGEHHGLLGGMLEAVIKKDYPEDFKRIIAITYAFSAGWRRVHNPETGHDVADDLTTTEFAVAMLAARDWTNQEISDHMGISPNTVKRHISTALQKLNIGQRKQLREFMLK